MAKMIWKGDKVEFASMELVREIVDQKAYKVFMWPDEYFDGKYPRLVIPTPEGYDDVIGEPLLIDLTTANAMCTVFDALNEKNQQKFTEWVAKDRAHFGKIVELCWQHVSFGSR